MQNFRAKIGKLRSFVERKHFDAMRIRDEPRVAGQHAVNIRPNLNFGDIECCTDNGGGKIRSSTAKCGGDSLLRCADVSGHYGHAFWRKRLDSIPDARICFFQDWRGTAMACIGDDEVARVEMLRV